MNPDSKYYPLFEHLQAYLADEVVMSFSQIEALMENRLPTSARQHRGWWSNRMRGGVQAQAWMDAGYDVVALDFADEQVTFRKPKVVYRVERSGETVLWQADLVKGLRQYMGLTQADLADELGVRQQTISEWETGIYAPSRAMSKYLQMVAERAEFQYLEEEE